MFPSKSTCIFCCLSTHCHWQCQMTLTSIGNKNCVFVSSAEFLLQGYLCKLLQPTYWQNQRTGLWGWIMTLGVWCGIVAYFQVQWSIKWVELRRQWHTWSQSTRKTFSPSCSSRVFSYWTCSTTLSNREGVNNCTNWELCALLHFLRNVISIRAWRSTFN